MNLYEIYHKWRKNANGFSLVGEKEKIGMEEKRLSCL